MHKNAIRKVNTERRDKAVIDRFNNIYHVERKRIDDAYKVVSEEFFLSESTVKSILKKKNK
jgi:hypothetical protein